MSTPVAAEAFSMPFVMCSLASFSTSGSMSVSCADMMLYDRLTVSFATQDATLSAYLNDGFTIGELLEVDGVERCWQLHFLQDVLISKLIQICKER